MAGSIARIVETTAPIAAAGSSDARTINRRPTLSPRPGDGGAMQLGGRAVHEERRQ
jgi:hypothetical protein